MQYQDSFITTFFSSSSAIDQEIWCHYTPLSLKMGSSDSDPLKWVFVLAILAVVQAVQFNRHSFEDEPLSEIGVIGIRSSDRIDVRTRLELSPWELFVINDLAFKLMERQCPKLNNDVLESLKEMLSNSFKKAPMVESQNAQFLPSYSQLVRCLEFIEEKPDAEKLKIIQAEKDMELEDKSVESDWAAKDALITTTTTTTEGPSKNEEEDELASTWMWGFRSIHRWIRDLFFKEEKGLEEQQKPKSREAEREKEQQKRLLIAYRMARQNYANFFHEISKIVRKSCPLIHRPDKMFMRHAMLDMATWVTLEQRETISSAAKYFRKHELLKLLQECFKEL